MTGISGNKDQTTMTCTLVQAPFGRSLRITRIIGADFSARMSRLGLYEGARLLRINEAAKLGAVKVRTTLGETVLSGWLAGQVVIHLDDDRRVPLLECRSLESGHVEGITGQDIVEDSLRALGITDGDRIQFLRRMPPMAYAFSVRGKGRASMSESMAAHVLGETAAGPRQFSSVGVGEVLTVIRILPGEATPASLASLHVTEGAELTLVNVSASPELGKSADHPVACVTKDGMRLYFREQDAASIIVSAEVPERTINCEPPTPL